MRICRIALILIATPLFGARFEFKTYYELARVPDSEICFLRPSDVSGVAGLLASPEVRCLPADKVLDLPRGEWFFYARNRGGLISAHRSEMHLFERSRPDSYKAVRMELVPAGTLDVSDLRLGPDERFFAWGTDSARYQAPVVMLQAGDTTLLVPAGSPVTPIITRHGTPVWAGRPIIVGPGEKKRLARTEPEADRMTVVAWIGYDKAPADATEPPAPVLTIDGTDYEPSNRIGPVRFGDFAAVIFHDVPRRAGAFWTPSTAWNATPIRFSAPSASGHLFIEKPLVLKPSI